MRVTSSTGSARRFVWEFEERKSWELDAKREGSTFRARRREANLHPMVVGPLETGAKWIRQHRRLCLSSLRRNLYLKVNKKVSYLNKKSLRVFEFRDSYVLSLWTFDVHFTHFAHGHIRVYGYVTVTEKMVWFGFFILIAYQPSWVIYSQSHPYRRIVNVVSNSYLWDKGVLMFLKNIISKSERNSLILLDLDVTVRHVSHNDMSASVVYWLLTLPCK